MNETRPRKLIEVALPLEAINVASAREKSIRHGHPSTLHLWWARRPLAAARAVIFAQMVDDPSAHPERFPTEEAQDAERQRLFRLIEELVKWDNTTNETVLQQARDEIWKSWRDTCAANQDHPRATELFDTNKLPAFHDPFAGGGSLPLEAQRLGLEAYASDLNPVAVLINKAMIEIPPKFAGLPPVNPEARKEQRLLQKLWKGAQGLAVDVRYYGKWMRDEAEKRIGHLYPKVEITAAMAEERPDLKALVGRELTVIAWLWARTVKSPNPAFAHIDVPLASTFMLSTKPGKEAYVEPVVEDGGYRFTVNQGKPTNVEAAKNGTRAGKAQDFLCLLSGVPIPRSYIREEGKAGRLGARLMAIVVEGSRGRTYLSPSETVAGAIDTEREAAAIDEARTTFLTGSTPTRAMITGGVCSAYGLSTWGDLFTSRQIMALTTFSDLVQEVRARVSRDAMLADLPNEPPGLDARGDGISTYADAIAVYLGFALSKATDRNSCLCVWENSMNRMRGTFGRQALPMVWDYVETNPFAGAGGDIYGTVHSLCEVLDRLGSAVNGHVDHADACTQILSSDKIVSTDPPYYDNISYADLSDFFYVWLRRALRPIFPSLFATLVVPKAEELVATLYRHGSKQRAEAFFLDGMTRAMSGLAKQAHPAFPVTVYYAFKQSETQKGGTASTGWETFLDAVMRAGFTLTGTWPIRTELENRLIGAGTNALASSIILVCRQRPENAPTATRREFVTALRTELPEALRSLQHGNVAPVDLAQAVIGPGMAIYTRYARVLDAEGKEITVRPALSLINQTLDEVLAEQEGDFDDETRWALAWFGDHGFDDGPFGEAHTYFMRFNSAENALKSAGLIASGRGKVRLLRPAELPEDWEPSLDQRLTVWEMVHHLIRRLETGGESAAAELMKKLGSEAELARELPYRLYTVCERKKRAAEALSYNGLVQSWPEISRLARETHAPQPAQPELFDRE